jgi:ubiquinone/menaquinone biosynthesis C-methylase UbiE
MTTTPATTPTSTTPPATHDADTVRRKVRQGYGRIADGTTRGCGCGCKSDDLGERLSEHLGYAAGDLDSLPEGADLGLSCGNPTALANLAPGQVVLDLGSGAGLDAFLAGPRVGAEGRVIGVDMTAEMLERARGGLAAYRRRTGLDNVEFRLGEIENLPVADASVDVVISNCVINLSPDKARVFREIARVLKPGGRVAVSDMALLQPLPEAVLANLEALVGCVAGAIAVDEYVDLMLEAGLDEVDAKPKAEYSAVMESFTDPTYRQIAADLPAGTSAGDFLTSLDVTAVKPAA